MHRAIPFIATIASAIATILTPATTTAQTAPLSDLHGREQPVGDLVPRPKLIRREPAASGTRLSLVVYTVQRPQRRDFTGSLLLSFPTDFLTSSRKAKERVADVQPLDGEPNDAVATDGRMRTVERASPLPDRSLLPVIRPRDARAALAAAQRTAGEPSAAAELDALGTRARWSSVLPQVRLRATRLIDESTSLSPTSYDAERTTMSGGASLWLEARASWSLDRLVFASEEVRVARLRRQLHDERMRRDRRVLATLFAWQRAAYAMHDPMVSPDRCLDAWLTEQQLAAELDVYTGGWFTRWRRQRLLPDVDCLAIFEEEAARRLEPSGAEAVAGEEVPSG